MARKTLSTTRVYVLCMGLLLEGCFHPDLPAGRIDLLRDASPSVTAPSGSGEHMATSLPAVVLLTLTIDPAAWSELRAADRIPSGWGRVWTYDLPLRPRSSDGPPPRPTPSLVLGETPLPEIRGARGRPSVSGFFFLGKRLVFAAAENGAGPTKPCRLTYEVDRNDLLDPFGRGKVPAAATPSTRYRLPGIAGDALPCTIPSSIRWRVRIPPQARLRFDLLVRCPDISWSDTRARVIPDHPPDIHVTVGLGDQTPWRRTIAPAKWQNGAVAIGVDLPPVPREARDNHDAEESNGSKERTLTVRIETTGDRRLAHALILDPRIEYGPEEAARRGVILIVFDTLRQDRLGCYGYPRPTSPNLDRFASQGVRFDRAHSSSNWTLPSHATLFLSRWAQEHGVLTGTDTVHRPAPTLARALSEAGLVTAAFTDGGYVGSAFGLAQGFGVYHDEKVGADRIFDDASEWLQARGGARFFLFLHTYQVHHPLEPTLASLHAVDPSYSGPTSSPDLFERSSPPPGGAVTSMAAPLGALYDASIRDADAAFGRFLDVLRREGLEDEVLCIVTSDHGEHLGERGHYGHARGFDRELLRIPLILRGGGMARPAVREDLVSLVDVAPTIATWLGLSQPASFEGRSLLTPVERRFVLAASEETLPNRRGFMICDGSWRLVEWLDEPSRQGAAIRTEWHPADAWAGEASAESSPGEAIPRNRLRTWLDEIRARAPSRQDRGEEASLSEEELATLRELGYANQARSP